MICLYITLFFTIVAGIVQTFIKSWNQLLYPRVIEVCLLPFEPRHDFFLHLIIVVELFPSEMFLWVKKQVEIAISSHSGFQKLISFLCVARKKLQRGTHPHLAFGGTLDRRCHFKHVSLKQSRFYHCQTSTAYR